MTQRDFANAHGVGLSTLNKWLRLERKFAPEKVKFKKIGPVQSPVRPYSGGARHFRRTSRGGWRGVWSNGCTFGADARGPNRLAPHAPDAIFADASAQALNPTASPRPSLRNRATARASVLLAILLGGMMAQNTESLAAADRAPESFAKTVAPFLEDHCYDCHGEGEKKGGLALDQLPVDFSSPENLRTWVNVLDRVQNGEMPPKKEPRPPAGKLTAATDWLRTALLAADARRQQSEGRVVARRLNRTEYENTLHDLLGIDTRLRDFLPEDNAAYGFDNIGSALNTSPELLDRYLEAANVALDAAIANRAKPETQTLTVSYHDANPAYVKSLFDCGDAMVFFNAGSPAGSIAANLPKSRTPAAGLYRYGVTVEAYQSKGQPVAFTVHGGAQPLGYFEAPPDQPATIEVAANLPAGVLIKIFPLGIGRR